MKTSFVSNMSFQTSMRLTIAKVQNEMMKAREEAVTGRHADVGVALGAKTARTLNLHRDLQRMEALKSTNALTTQRLAASQAALGQMSEAGNSAMGVLIALSGMSSGDQLSLARDNIGDAMAIFTSAANTSFSGEYLFAGINSDVMPLKDYLAEPPISAARQSFQDAFDGFMLAEGYTSTEQITPEKMQEFISDFSLAFEAGWETDWSNASNENMQSRISTSETVQSSTNANAAGMRKMALGLVLGYELLTRGLTEGTRKAATDAAIGYMGEAISGIDGERSRLGISEARVKQATTSLSAQISILTKGIMSMEQVDPEEAVVRGNDLKTQLSVAYKLTVEIQNLSLLNYL